MIELALPEAALVVRANDGDFRPRHESQLAYWGFQHDPDSGTFSLVSSDSSDMAGKLVSYFERAGLPFQVDANLQALLKQNEEARRVLQTALEKCRQLKDGKADPGDATAFRTFLNNSLSRPLKDHQFKAALHLLCAQNGANFSVPGSGKTSVVLAVFEWLREQGEVDSLFVVGPPACFAPWRYEYKAVLGKEPKYDILAGGNVNDRRTRYLVDSDSVGDLYLTTFQTLQRDWEHVRLLFQQRGIRFFLVVDEAHYIKQPGGIWASAVLRVAKQAVRRCVLTGTPLPHSYVDAFNLFEALWPDNSPLTIEQQHRIELHSQRNEHVRAAELLDASIGPLFYRVRKEELHLAPQEFHEPMRIRMNQHERLLYDSVLDRIQYASQSDYFRDHELLVRLRRGRMIRLRQCISYAALLGSAVTEYSEDLVSDPSLADLIRHYDTLETPAKLEALLTLVSQLRQKGERIVIWSNFVRTLKLIENRLSALGHGVRLIYGGTPFENTSVQDELTRETIIREFTDPSSAIDILVANPAACAESISLHKTCSQSVYYDLTYNCAQYLQSLDRIHRVGGSEDKVAHYHFLQYEDSIDADILANVRNKAENMSAVIDQDYPIYSLDMFAEDEELEAYTRLFADDQPDA